MSIHDLLTPNPYNIYLNSLVIASGVTNSFRKSKSSIQSISPLDPPGSTISFDTFAFPFSYNDSTAANFTFIDPSNIMINKTGVYQIDVQVTGGNEIPNSFYAVGLNLQGSIIGMSISILVQSQTMIPFNNGLHSQNAALTMSGMCMLNANDIIQAQYLLSDVTDIYPGSYISLKYISV